LQKEEMAGERELSRQIRGNSRGAALGLLCAASQIYNTYLAGDDPVCGEDTDSCRLII
jgi:hypothetical protein